MELSAYAVAAILAGGLAIGFGLGLLRDRANGRRARELATRLETASKERELSREELNVARETLRRVEREHQAYRQQVSDHFGGASEQLRELTIRYRALYEHLAQGASALCPEGFKGLEGGFEALASSTGDEAAAESRGDGTGSDASATKADAGTSGTKPEAETSGTKAGEPGRS